MGIAFRNVDVARNRLWVTADGLITISDVRTHLVEEQQELLLPYRELIDARRAVIQFSAQEVREIVALLRSMSYKDGFNVSFTPRRLGPTAVVVSTDLAFGVMRMLEILVEDVCIIKPFRDTTEAEQWLDTFA